MGHIMVLHIHVGYVSFKMSHQSKGSITKTDISVPEEIFVFAAKEQKTYNTERGFFHQKIPA